MNCPICSKVFRNWDVCKHEVDGTLVSFILTPNNENGRTEAFIDDPNGLGRVVRLSNRLLNEGRVKDLLLLV